MEWSFVILLVGYRSNDNRFRVYENVEETAILILSIFLRKYYLQYTNFLRMNDKESVNVSSVIPAYALEKQEQIKTASLFKPSFLIGLLIQPKLAKWLRYRNSFWWKI